MGEKSVRSQERGAAQELQALGQKSVCPHPMDAVGLNRSAQLDIWFPKGCTAVCTV